LVLIFDLGKGARSMGSGVAMLIVIVLIAAGGAGFYLFWKLQNGASARERRLAYVERMPLDGGRSLLLLRRDDVEHLVMIGGPIDVVVETGIRAQGLSNGIQKASDHDLDRTNLGWDGAWRRPERAHAAGEPAAPREPQLSLSASDKLSDEQTLLLTPLHEAKPAH
jgi:hypothetical protein